MAKRILQKSSPNNERDPRLGQCVSLASATAAVFWEFASDELPRPRHARVSLGTFFNLKDTFGAELPALKAVVLQITDLQSPGHVLQLKRRAAILVGTGCCVGLTTITEP